MRSAWLLLAAMPALAQPDCTVQAQERLASATARFSVGSTSIAVTVPVGFRVEFLTVYLEVTNPQPGLFLQIGAQKIPVRDGASFNLDPEVDERPVFSLVNGDGGRLCSWQPGERVWAYDPPADVALTLRLHRLMRNALPWFFIAGDPLVLAARSKTAKDFTIDGEPARVLARTTRQVILRDPKPSSGFRTVKAQRYEVMVAMVEVEKRVSDGSLQMKITGPEVLTGGAAVTIFNLNRAAAELHCGSAVHHREWPEAARLPLSGDEKGVFTGACALKLHSGGEPEFDLMVQEQRTAPGQKGMPRVTLPSRRLNTLLEADHG